MRGERVAGLVLALALALWVSLLLVRYTWTIVGSKFAYSMSLQETPSFIWTYRWADLFAQAFLLLASVLAVAALLREKEGPGVEEEAVEEGT